MKVVFALLANDDIENLACKIMLDAHREGELGLLSGRVSHLAISMSQKSTEFCQSVFEKLHPKELNLETKFDKLGLIYIDGDEINPDNFFCYKRISLS